MHITSTISDFSVEEYKNLFCGSERNYGVHVPEDSTLVEGKKREGKSFTIHDQLLTVKEYKDHLLGKKGLGIIPINTKSKCKFSVIDVDIYDMDYTTYLEAIETNSFPIVPFKSKSGGLHLYVFYKEWVTASKAIEFMKKLAFLLSIDMLVKSKTNRTVEIFPKQKKITKDNVGSWINLPYFDALNSRSHALKGTKELNFEEALTFIKSKIIGVEEIEEFITEIPYWDAPPCLQILNILNPFSESSGRNNYLFSFAVYLKKKDENFYEQNLLEVNDVMPYPLEEKEIESTILSSLRRKDYIYRCSETPCVDFCNRKECRNREYGIGKDGGYFSNIELGKLTQYKADQPYYEWEVKNQGEECFKKLRFKSEEEIIRQDVFLKLCMRELYKLPSKLKQSEWFKRVNTALKEIEIIVVEEEEDTSPIVILKSLVSEFLEGKKLAEIKSQILGKRVYYNESTDEYWFRMKDLIEHLFIHKNWHYFQSGELHGILREWGAYPKKISTETGRQIRITSFPKGSFSSVLNEYKDLPEFEPEGDF